MTSHPNVRISSEPKYIRNGPFDTEKYSVQVRYCSDCSYPLDYADYSPVKDCSCKEDLISEQLDKTRISNAAGKESKAPAGGDGAGDATAATVSGDDDDEAVGEDGKKRQKRGGKTAAKSAAKAKKAFGAVRDTNIHSSSMEKEIRVVTGLGKNGIDLKVAAKVFGQKFACGSSVSGDDEIVIQGDVREDLIDLIPETWPQIDEDLIEDDGDHKRA